MSPAPPPDPRKHREKVPVPDDLAEVCLKAMAKRKRDRHGSAAEVLADVTAAIEGGKERQRNHQKCVEKLQEARKLVAEYQELGQVIESRKAAVSKARAAVKAWEPVDVAGKATLVALEQALEETRWLAGESFNSALAAFNEALGHERDNAEARRDLAEFHYFHKVRAESQRDARTFAFHRKQVDLFNDSNLDDRLRGDGSVTIASNPPGAEVLLYGVRRRTRGSSVRRGSGRWGRRRWSDTSFPWGATSAFSGRRATGTPGCPSWSVAWRTSSFPSPSIPTKRSESGWCTSPEGSS